MESIAKMMNRLFTDLNKSNMQVTLSDSNESGTSSDTLNHESQYVNSEEICFENDTSLLQIHDSFDLQENAKDNIISQQTSHFEEIQLPDYRMTPINLITMLELPVLKDIAENDNHEASEDHAQNVSTKRYKTDPVRPLLFKKNIVDKNETKVVYYNEKKFNHQSNKNSQQRLKLLENTHVLKSTNDPIKKSPVQNSKPPISNINKNANKVIGNSNLKNHQRPQTINEQKPGTQNRSNSRNFPTSKIPSTDANKVNTVKPNYYMRNNSSNKSGLLKNTTDALLCTTSKYLENRKVVKKNLHVNQNNSNLRSLSVPPNMRLSSPDMNSQIKKTKLKPMQHLLAHTSRFYTKEQPKKPPHRDVSNVCKQFKQQPQTPTQLSRFNRVRKVNDNSLKIFSCNLNTAPNLKLSMKHDKLPSYHRSLSTPSDKSDKSNLNQSNFHMSVNSDLYKLLFKSDLKPFCETVDFNPNRRLIKLSLLKNQQLCKIINMVNSAQANKKTFTIVGNYPVLRKALVRRGWIEKFSFLWMSDEENYGYLEHLPILKLLEAMKRPKVGEKYQRALISKMLTARQVDFYWDLQLRTKAFVINSDKNKQTLINKYPQGRTLTFSTKIGLLMNLKYNLQWFCIEDTANVFYPRTYNLACEQDKLDFIEDFQITASASLLKWIVNASEDNVRQFMSSAGEIPLSVYNFAFLQCQNYLKIKQHKDIDENVKKTKGSDWNVFLTNFYKIIHLINHFQENDKITKEEMIQESKEILSTLEIYWPHMKMDGYMNLWIIKPHNDNKGHGVMVCRNLKYILDVVRNTKNRKYIVQKYIERPLLICNTKFDIRQWYIIAHVPTLHIWMYKDCYLRFSSQTYNLHKLHESIHLTNNAVQRKYKSFKGDTLLPLQNMWHSDKFKTYLKSIGHPHAWKNTIYKGMKETMVGVMLCSQDAMSHRINSYELYGVDFMLTEEFQPYLIEINSNPALNPSTDVTAKLCPQMLNDLIKVTVDYRRNPNLPTGRFELIHKENHRPLEEKKASLSVSGINYFEKYKVEEKISETESQEPIDTIVLNAESIEKAKDVIENMITLMKEKGIYETSETNIRDHEDLDDPDRTVSTTSSKTFPVNDAETEYCENDSEKQKNYSKQFLDMISEFANLHLFSPTASKLLRTKSDI